MIVRGSVWLDCKMNSGLVVRHALLHEQSNRVRGRLPAVVSRALVSPAVSTVV